MTEQDAEKLIAVQIAGMREDLALIAGTTDADNLIPLVFEKTRRMTVSSMQLRRLVWRFARTRVVAEYHWTMKTVKNELYMMRALTETAERRPELKAKLLPSVARKVPLVDAHLDKLARALSEMKTEAVCC